METRNKIPMWMDAVGKGWHPILEALHADLTELVPDYTVVQVKEKFGGLRVYLDWVATPASPEIFQAVDAAEALSLSTCEECGKAGSLKNVNQFYVRTLCEPCLNTVQASRTI